MVHTLKRKLSDLPSGSFSFSFVSANDDQVNCVSYTLQVILK